MTNIAIRPLPQVQEPYIDNPADQPVCGSARRRDHRDESSSGNRVLREYPLLVKGEEFKPSGWTYVLRASEMLRAPMESLNAKSALELGTFEGDLPPAVEARCAWGGREATHAAIDAAATAFPIFSAMPFSTRLDIVRGCHELFRERMDELIDILVIEGHPRRLARWEVSGLLAGSDESTLRFLAAKFEEEFRVGDERIRLVRKPDGVVAVNPPQNAAASNSCLGILALMAGNTLVVKAPCATPLGVMFIYHEIVQPVLDKCGAPPGTLNIISGGTRDVLRDWLDHPKVADVVFFGGSDVGLKVGQDCVTRNKKPVLELAGNDALVVWKDADLDQAAAAAAECFYGSTQICMVPKQIIAHPAIAAVFITKLVAQVKEIRPGFAEDDETLLSPVLKSELFFDYLREAREAGCEILHGGSRVDVAGKPDPMGFFLEPTLVKVDGFPLAEKLSCVREETFFPLLPIVVPMDAPDLLEQAIGFINDNHYGLRCSLWSTSDSLIETFTNKVINAGQIKVNTSHIGFHSYLSGHGGTGRTGGPFGELNYLPLRTSHLQGIAYGTGVARALDSQFGCPAAATSRTRHRKITKWLRAGLTGWQQSVRACADQSVD